MIIETTVCMQDGDELRRVLWTLKQEGWIEEVGHRMVFETQPGVLAVCTKMYRTL